MQLEQRYEQVKEEQERERQQKLREHRQQYQVVSYKNIQARALDLSYDEKLRHRQRMARGSGLYVPGAGYENNLQNVEVLRLGGKRGTAAPTSGEKETTFGPVHFVKELRVSSFSKH